LFRKRSFLVIILLIFIKPAVGQISEAEVKKILINLPHISIDSVKRDSLQSRLFQEDEDVILSIFKRIISSKDLPRGFNYDSKITIEAIKTIVIMNSQRGWNLLIEFVGQWASEPYSEDYWMGGRPREAFLLEQTCRVLAKSPPDVLSKIDELAQSNRDNTIGKWFQITMGLAGQDNYFNEIMKLLESDPDPYIREYAAFALREIGRKECIGLLENALKDTFYVEETFETAAGDVIVLGRKKYYVREAASKALRRLGVKVRRKEFEFWIEE
jgi:hypothetical protein